MAHHEARFNFVADTQAMAAIDTGAKSKNKGQSQLKRVSKTIFQFVPAPLRNIPAGFSHQSQKVGTADTNNAARNPDDKPHAANWVQFFN